MQGYSQLKINFPPTIDPIPDYGPVPENSGLHSILLTGISSGEGEEAGDQFVTITASSSNQNLISNLTVKYGQGTTALLSFSLLQDANGKTTITVTLDDGQRFFHITERDFDVTVSPVNSKPFFELSTTSISINEDQGKVDLKNFVSRFDDGDPELNQKLEFITSVKSTSQFLTFRSVPVIDKKNGDLTFEIDPNAYGQASVSVLLQDNGGTANGGIDTSDETVFTIQVTNINDPPTINDVSSPLTIPEDAGEQIVELTGISSGINENQQVQFLIQSDNQPLISNFNIQYQQGDDKAFLTFSPNANQFGQAQITVTINDGQSVNNQMSIQFLVIVYPVADTPAVTSAITVAGVQTTSGLVISRNSADGNEVTHFKITNIQNGLLYQHNGSTQISNNSYITYQQGNAGLKFTPFNGTSSNGSFDIQGATGNDDTKLGGGIVTAQIVIDNDPPEIISTPDSIVEITKLYTYTVIATDPNETDVLSFTFNLPQSVKPWLNARDNNDGTATLSGTPPSGSAGLYEIYIKVEDQFGAFDEQKYNLRVNKLNNKPELSPFSKGIKEDETIYFTKDDFTQRFIDADGDTLHTLKVVSEPQYGKLFLNGIELGSNDVFEISEIAGFIYMPKNNYHGLDIFDWNASDGKDFAQVPQRVNIFISSVNDPPQILKFEDNPFTFEYGEEKLSLTDSGEVIDADGDNLSKAVLKISSNYMEKEDSLYYEDSEIEGLTFNWIDTSGVLLINGIANPSVFQQAIRSVAYVNSNRLAPNGFYREIEIVLYDADTFSMPYTRRIEFKNTFVDLDIPSGFTPNDDGVNDTWNIENLSRYEDILVAIYSRTGLKVFESNNYLKEWDGYYKGNMVPVGTYFYLININKFEKVFKGTVTVLR